MGEKEIWGISTFILISTQRQTGINANTLSEEQIASGFYSRRQPHAWHVYIWATMCIHKECKSESGIIANFTKVKSAMGTMKRFWSSLTNPCLCTCSRLSIPCYIRLTRLMGRGEQWKIPDWGGLFFFFLPPAVLSFNKKEKKRERSILSFHSKEEKIKVVWLL